jgi:PST family polysaccharide transporter
MDPNAKYTRLYDTSHLQAGIGARSMSGGVALLASQLVVLVLGIARGGIMARFLSPVDYGIQGMVLAFLSLALIFKDLGLSTAIIREDRITHDQVSNLFWFNSGLGLLSAAITIVAGPILGWFYSQPQLIMVCAVMSVSYLLGSLCVQPQALLQRQMRFGALSTINVCSNVGASIVGVGMAWKACGYWSLIGMQIATNLFQLIGTGLVANWRPSWYNRNCSIKKMLRFGGHVTGLNIFFTFSKHADAILIGRFCGAESLGFYSRGLLPISQIEGQLRMALSGVALPALSSLQHAPDRFVSYYLRFVSILAFLSMPIATYCFVFSDTIIHFYLGAKWQAVVPYFRLFALAAFFSPVMLSLDRIPLACGRARQYLYMGVLGGTVKVIGIAIGVIFWGPMGAAVAMVVTNLIIWITYYLLAVEGSPLHARDYMLTLAAPLTLSVASGLLAWLATFACGNNRLLVILIGSGVFWVCCAGMYVTVDLLEIGCKNKLVRKLQTWRIKRAY